jgi:hypothetical protein
VGELKNKTMFGNILSSLKAYQTSWEVVKEGQMKPEEMAQVTKCQIVPSTYGISLKMFLTNGTVTYVPVDEQNSTLCVGDTPVLSELTFILLTKNGEEIYRVK